MQYHNFLLSSLRVFITCFFFGSFIDTIFKKLTKKYFNGGNYKLTVEHKLILLSVAFTQLFIIISTTFLLHKYKFFHDVFEDYTPHILFSTFLLSLQETMLYNIRRAFGISSNNH